MALHPGWPHNQRMEPRELANSICETLRANRYQALLVGGCVRDILLARKPADFDVATDATPDEVLKLFPDGVTVGAQFGVIAVFQNGIRTEIATFRADVGYSNAPDSEDEMEPAKAAFSDGLKRAAVGFGVGRWLYEG